MQSFLIWMNFRACTMAASPSSLLSAWALQSDLPPIRRALDAPAPGARIGEYEILRRLGEGEFATVWECVKASKKSGDRYACKAIDKARVQQRSLVKCKRNIGRVAGEVVALRRCGHAGVVRLLDVAQGAAHVFLILERGDRDLYAFLDDHPEGCDEVVVRRVARSVETNHWFRSAQATLKLVELAQNEVFSARSWTGDHLCARDLEVW